MNRSVPVRTIELEQQADGAWSVPAPEPPPSCLEVAPGGRIVVSGPAGANAVGTVPVDTVPVDTVPVSTVPTVRMAAGPDPWAKVFRDLRLEEQGAGTGLEVAPGGQIVPASGRGAPVSRVPEVRMASAVNEAAELAALDPERVEGWTPVRSRDGAVSGWSFRLAAPYHPPFRFLTFRNPSRGNGWEISPLYPNLDHEWGHDPHMIRAQMGVHSVPILCGPAGVASRTLTEVRGTAAKWTHYTSARLAGVDPGFSL